MRAASGEDAWPLSALVGKRVGKFATVGEKEEGEGNERGEDGVEEGAA